MFLLQNYIQNGLEYLQYTSHVSGNQTSEISEEMYRKNITLKHVLRILKRMEDNLLGETFSWIGLNATTPNKFHYLENKKKNSFTWI